MGSSSLPKPARPLSLSAQVIGGAVSCPPGWVPPPDYPMDLLPKDWVPPPGWVRHD